MKISFFISTLFYHQHSSKPQIILLTDRMKEQKKEHDNVKIKIKLIKSAREKGKRGRVCLRPFPTHGQHEGAVERKTRRGVEEVESGEI